MNKNRYALIGWPVAHSASPLMQEAAFRAVGLDASYELIAVPPQTLSETIVQLKLQGYNGWNVTVPHKEAVLPLMDILDPGSAENRQCQYCSAKTGQTMGLFDRWLWPG